MIQPYFDPTVSFQGGSIFSQYLQGFVKERSAMNRQIMELALAQADPTFLQKQIQLMNENIIALEKAKAKAQVGDAKAKQDLLRITSPFARISYQYEKDIGVVEKEMGGKALTTLNAKDAAVKVAMTEKTKEDREKAITKLLADESDPVARTALLIAIEEQTKSGSPAVDKSKLSGYSAPGMKRPVFLSQYGGSTGITPYTTRVSEMLDFVEGKIGADTPANEAAFNSQIDAAIKKYEDQRAMYEKQLTDLQEGGVDAFAGFSRNYMLDNPFIQMSRSQGKVDALASAIEAAQKEDFRTMPPMPPAPEPDIVQPFDSDDEAIAFQPFLASERTESVVFNPDEAIDEKGERTGKGFSVEREILTGTGKLPTQTFAELEIRNPDVASDFYKMVGGFRDRVDVNDSKLMQQKNRTSALNKLQTGKGLDAYERFLTEQSAEDLDAVIDDIYSMSRRDLRRLNKKYPTFNQGNPEVLSQ